MMKRMPIVFNMENPHQKDLYDWCQGQTTNFSGFVREILFAYRSAGAPPKGPTQEKQEQPSTALSATSKAKLSQNILSIF